MRGSSGKYLGGYGEKRRWTLAPRLWHGLSPHFVCKKSPNLLVALLPLLNLKHCWRWVRSGAGKGRFPGEIRPKKECIKSCETYFANTLILNDKGPSMKWVCSPKFYGPLAIWPWLRISPQSSLNVIYLVITAWQWLMSFLYMPCIPMQIKPIKACQGRWGALLLREWPCCPFSSTGLSSPCEFVSLSHNAANTACLCLHHINVTTP